MASLSEASSPPALQWAQHTSEAVLRSYAQILFSRSPVVGGLLLLASSLQPGVALMGLAAVLLATFFARLLHLSEEQIQSGLFGYNAVLVGVGGAALLGLEPGAVALTLFAVMASVLVTAATHSALSHFFALPALTVPFLLVFFLMLGAAPLLDLPILSLPADPQTLNLPAPLRLFFQSLGAIFFMPRVEVGMLVCGALLWHSRIGTLLAVFGFALVYAAGLQYLALSESGVLAIVLGYNALLVAIGLGGEWFVPSWSSFALAGLAVASSMLFSLGLLAPFSRLGLPLLILPFNATVFLFLYSMRQRMRDGKPKAVDFLMGTPEENLNYYRTRVARFGARYALRFQLPFMGTWSCTQGVNGEHTHKGAWRHGLDFEVLDATGAAFRGAGAVVEDYLCWRLPVLAVADGTVVKVLDGVDDNPIGALNLENNWGNVVIVYHAPGVYSLLAHMAKGSVKVQEGQLVRQGQVLGLCGNSGRSPVPHIHLHLQATAVLGSPTIDAELHDVVELSCGHDAREAHGESTVSDAALCLRGAFTPRKGSRLRNLEVQPAIANLFDFPHGSRMDFVLTTSDDEQKQSRETVVAEIDLYGSTLMRSQTRNATLYFEKRGHIFTIFDSLGSPRSVLRMLHIAMGRVPFELREGLKWSDHLPARHVVSPLLRPLLDFVSPFRAGGGLELDYTLERETESDATKSKPEGEDSLRSKPEGWVPGTASNSLGNQAKRPIDQKFVVEGVSKKQYDGAPLLRTVLRLQKGRGIESVELIMRGRRTIATRVEREPAN